jgi:hypothetical protein
MASRIQRSLGISGDLLEIGAYEGKSAILLGYLTEASESLTVSDLFETSPSAGEQAREVDRFYGDLRREAFESNYRRFHGHVPRIIEGPSNGLAAHCAPGRFRMVHIDGSHVYEDVMEDIELSRSLLKAGGLVVIDDVRSPHTPGVWAAAWDAVSLGLIPLAVSAKMYGIWSGPRDELYEALKDGVEGHSQLDLEEHRIREHTLMSVRYVSHAPQPSSKRRWARLWR